MAEWFAKENCHISTHPGYEAFSQRAAALVVSLLAGILEEKDAAVFVPSAGKTSTGLYRILYEKYRNALEWDKVTVVQMDEYRGVSCTDPRSMAACLHKHLVSPLGVKEFVHFNDDRGNLLSNFSEYENSLKDRGGIDLVVHGIGRNGHIGFNEPGSDWSSETRSVDLAASTLEANFAGQDIDLRDALRTGVTLGLGVLTKARHAVLLLSGSHKSEIVRRFFQEEPDPGIPASSLSMNDEVHILVDRETIVGVEELIGGLVDIP